MHITVYECSACGKRHWDGTNMRRHITTARCHGATLHERLGIVTIALDAVLPPPPHPPPSPELLAGCVPTYDGGDETRIDLVFASPDVVERLLNIWDVCRVAPLMFEALWSERAPAHVQSIALHKDLVYEVESDGSIVCRGRPRKKYIRALTAYVIEFTRAVLRYSVPVRRPQDTRRATRVLDALERADAKGVTLQDALDRNATYCRWRPPEVARMVDRVETAMASSFMATVRHE